MSAATAEDAMLLTELWLSFASVMRSYAAVGDSAAEIASTQDSIIAISGAAQLAMYVDPQSGAGNWHIQRDGVTTAQGAFVLLPEGRIELDGRPLDLDHAAIDFVALVKQAGNEP
jgi:hypothetical protein